MIYDFYAFLYKNQEKYPQNINLPTELISGFVDWCTIKSKYHLYINKVNKVKKLKFHKDIEQLYQQWSPKHLHTNWFALEIVFELLTSWYSKDDRIFHVLDNPLRKDRVFGIPFMSAASWKGLLRWACCMQNKLYEQDKNFKEWIKHLFGNEKEKENFFGKDKKKEEGALLFYPTWFNKIGFEVINPHNRSTNAGTMPIFYEVVPGRRPNSNKQIKYENGAYGTLCLLYAPYPGLKAPNPQNWIDKFFKAIEELLTRYGISAKRTVGWGTTEIKQWKAWVRDKHPIVEESWKSLQERILQALHVDHEQN
ncbi:RAMP superfamily CRISPR-associated protein [Methylacidiphilum caldifontis]|uniref:CRISPR type III-associated protein domain-containing protein n=1 Tax=Methylacidiphilum caldifontis TaxID=2795386 RepID=A0A4Y8PD48_9BACT|nr:RAMP superfamily CRISPR-associated protein [Methylacidiphilum caldifontis]TFE67819.1 hypothetical protein A7Q10_09065 [Methylacidiphilum caldifontis]